MVRLSMDNFEQVTNIMCDAIESAEAWYCEILAQRYSGKDASEWAYGKLDGLDAEALRATELYRKMTLDMYDDIPGF